MIYKESVITMLLVSATHRGSLLIHADRSAILGYSYPVTLHASAL